MSEIKSSSADYALALFAVRQIWLPAGDAGALALAPYVAAFERVPELYRDYVYQLLEAFPRLPHAHEIKQVWQRSERYRASLKDAPQHHGALDGSELRRAAEREETPDARQYRRDQVAVMASFMKAGRSGYFPALEELAARYNRLDDVKFYRAAEVSRCIEEEKRSSRLLKEKG